MWEKKSIELTDSRDLFFETKKVNLSISLSLALEPYSYGGLFISMVLAVFMFWAFIDSLSLFFRCQWLSTKQQKRHSRLMMWFSVRESHLYWSNLEYRTAKILPRISSSNKNSTTVNIFKLWSTKSRIRPMFQSIWETETDWRSRGLIMRWMSSGKVHGQSRADGAKLFAMNENERLISRFIELELY